MQYWGITLIPIRQDKKHTDDQNQNTLQKIPLQSMPFWPKPQLIDKCHFLSLKLSTLCYAVMNSIVPSTTQLLALLEQLTQRTRDSGKLLQSPYFLCPPTPSHQFVAKWIKLQLSNHRDFNLWMTPQNTYKKKLFWLSQVIIFIKRQSNLGSG